MKRPPNIIFIIIDAARRDHFSSYGYWRKTSPFLDDFSKEGVFFENAYSTAPWTVPSHASFFTGLFPCEHKAQNDNLFLDKRIPTLAERMSENGYRTVGFSDNMYVGTSTGLNRGFQQFFEVWRKYRQKSKLDTVYLAIKRLVHLTDRGGGETTELIIDWIKNRDKNRPFFLFVNYIDVHQVCHPPKRFLEKFPECKYSYLKMIKFMRAYLNGRVKFYTNKIKFTDQDWENFKWIYDASINYIDWNISRIVDCLVKEEIMDNTMLIITSDHGTHFGEHGLLHHEYSVDEILLRVPLFIIFKAKFESKRVTKNIQLNELFDFILSEAGIEKKPSRLMASEDNKPVFAEWGRPKGTIRKLSRLAPKFDFSKFDKGLTSIKVGNLKYIRSTDGQHELYDLEKDPGEENNLYATNSEIVKKMEDEFEKFTSRLSRQYEDAHRNMKEDEELKRRLRSLGYI